VQDAKCNVESEIAEIYRRRIAEFEQRRQQTLRQADRVSLARIFSFLVGGGCIVLGLAAEGPGTPWFVLGGMLFVGFASMVWQHRRLLARGERLEQSIQINRDALGRVRRKWKRVRPTRVSLPDDGTPTADDLDLFGRASLFHLTCTATTPTGMHTLRDWLLTGAEPEAIARRQAAVAELAGQLDLRQELQCSGSGLADGRHDPEAFLRWAEGEPYLAGRRWLQWAARLLPLLMTALLVLGVAGRVPGTLWLAVVAVNLTISVIFCGEVHRIFGYISTREGEIRTYGKLFAQMATAKATSPELAGILEQITTPAPGAAEQLGRLGRIMDLANIRFSDAAHSIAQYTTLWDFHVLAILERWQRRCGRQARAWFEALGRFEALASLASLAHDNPGWTFATVEPQETPVLEAKQLGHPLLPDDVRVANDVTVGPPESFLLVTGSNMSGKSTLLRSLGTNVVLAQAGGPVCAAELKLPPVELATSMRIDDSLEDGVSFFLAELKRLKQIVDRAPQCSGRRPRTLLYLLDEILQGTNTAERQIAVRRVLAHLLEQGAVGAVSTHDLEVAADGELSKSCRPVHFRETIHGAAAEQQMTFDYRLRDGVATTTNALKLLDMVGLGEAESGESGAGS